MPSALRKLVVPPPLAGTNPAADVVTNGRVVSSPVLLLSSRVLAS
jgi:hypothetical protein